MSTTVVNYWLITLYCLWSDFNNSFFIKIKIKFIYIKKKVCKVCIYNFHDFVNHILHQRVNFTLGKLTINFKAFFLLTGPYQNLKTVKETITDRLNF